MKAVYINGSIKTFRHLPSTWEDEKGLHLNFTKIANPKAFGFYDVVTPSHDSQTQRLSAMLFDAAKEIFTHTVGDIDFNEVIDGNPVYDIEALKKSKIQSIKAEAGGLLQSTDWYIIRLAERSVEIPQDVSKDRLDIVNKSNTFEAEITALTSYVEVLKYTHTFFPQDILGV